MSSTGRSSMSVRSEAARWRMPPESVAGRARSRPARPAACSKSRARARRVSFTSPRRRAPSRTLSSRPSQGRSGVVLAHPGHQRRTPVRGSKRTVPPASRAALPAISLSSVDLPQPLGPSTQGGPAGGKPQAPSRRTGPPREHEADPVQDDGRGNRQRGQGQRFRRSGRNGVPGRCRGRSRRRRRPGWRRRCSPCPGHRGLHVLAAGQVGGNGRTERAAGAVVVAGDHALAGQGDQPLFRAQVEAVVTVLRFQVAALDEHVARAQGRQVHGRGSGILFGEDLPVEQHRGLGQVGGDQVGQGDEVFLSAATACSGAACRRSGPPSPGRGRCSSPRTGAGRRPRYGSARARTACRS